MLRRSLNHYDGAALVVSNVVGVGIFTTPGIVAGLVGERGAFLGVWTAGGLYALAGAAVYARLATLLPRAGGEYLYLRRAFGPLAGFLTGWTSFVAGFSGAIAAAAVGFAAYLGRFLPAAADARPVVELPGAGAWIELSPRTLTALAAIGVISAVHALGVQPGRHLQRWLAGGCLLAIAVLVIGGLAASPEAVSATGVPPTETSESGASAWLLALIPVLFTYSGWNAAVYVAEEIADPRRQLWRALMLGTGTVIAAYLALNLLYLYALPFASMAGKIEIGDAAAEVLFGEAGAALVTAVVLLALASSVGAMVMAGPRVYLAMARDGLFPRALGRVDRRFETPAVAIAAQAAWSSLLVLTGTFEALLIYTGFSVVLFSGVAAAALVVLRRRERREPITLGGPWLPAAFALASLLVVVNAVASRPVASGWGLVLISAGIPLYAWMRRRGGLR